MTLEHLRIALITFANPEKNFSPSFKLVIESNSSNDAPEQKVLPSLCNTTTLTSELVEIVLSSSVSFFNNSLGNELLAGWLNVIVAILSRIITVIVPCSEVVITFLFVVQIYKKKKVAFWATFKYFNFLSYGFCSND